MKKQYFNAEENGFFGAYFENPQVTDKCIILMLGDDVDDRLAISGVKWMHKKNCNVLTMSPAAKDYGHHSYPLERFEKAIAFLKSKGNKKIGIAGASTTGMLALVAASYFSDISLTLAFSPSDFIMEGFYRDRLDGARERPGNFESSLSFKGKQLPFLPYAYRHPIYWQMIKKESKESGNMIASRKLFDESEQLHPIKEEEKIKVENIKGKIVFIGAEDDVLWDTAKYIRRMEARLNKLPHDCEWETLIYEHGTHFIFPQSLLEIMFPLFSGLFVRIAFKAARDFPHECKAARIDIDEKLSGIISKWFDSSK